METRTAGTVWKFWAGLLAVSLLSGCGVDVVAEPPPTMPRERETLFGDVTAEALDIRAEEDNTLESEDPICQGYIAKAVDWTEQQEITVTAIPVGCEPGWQRSLNGYIGTYRSPSDADELRGKPTSVTTPIGAAQVFQVRYTECTNSCTDLDVPIAVVSLDRPLTVDGVEFDALSMNSWTFYNEGNTPKILEGFLATLERS